jgi:4-hydroxy-tetrahydrodipicolinate reductase
MTIRVLVNGAFGRMGQMTVNALTQDSRFELVGQAGRTQDLVKAMQDSRAEVVVDFTHPDAVFGNTQHIIDAGAHPVIGTSGLTRDHIKTLTDLAAKKRCGGLIAPNFSLGAVLLMKHAALIAKYLPHVEIIELHHDKKVDSPSHTALRTAELMKEACPHLNQPPHLSQEIALHARGALYQHVPIHAVRLPGLLANEQVIFGQPGETLTLTHHSIDRQCFMPGVLLACEKVMSLDRLIYGLEHLLP